MQFAERTIGLRLAESSADLRAAQLLRFVGF